MHHLRDDCLTLTRWDAESLTSHLTRSLDEHDRFGATPTWRFLPPHILSEHLDPGDGQRWYSVDHDERLRRGLALQAMMLALPRFALPAPGRRDRPGRLRQAHRSPGAG